MAWNAHRVFEQSDGQLKSISDEHDRIKASLSSAQSYKWDEVLDPLTPPEERNFNLTELLGLPSSGEAEARAACLGHLPLQSKTGLLSMPKQQACF